MTEMKLTDAKWIFFDMGHTLVDEDEAHTTRAEVMCEEIFELTGRKVTVDEFMEEAERQGTAGVSGPLHAAMLALGGKTYPRYDSSLELPYPESREVLERLHKKYKIGIIANQRGGSAKRLRDYRLLDFVDLVYSSVEMGYSKPSSAFYLSALTAADCKPCEAVMVGDRTDNDVKPAKKVGMMTVRIRQGFYRSRPSQSEADTPDADIQSIASLPELFGV